MSSSSTTFPRRPVVPVKNMVEGRDLNIFDYTLNGSRGMLL